MQITNKKISFIEDLRKNRIVNTNWDIDVIIETTNKCYAPSTGILIYIYLMQ